LRTPTDIRSYASFDEMIVQVLGSEIPVNALFSWLKGQPVSASGWQADLSDLAAGRITAKRTQPAPLAELRLTLEP
jgi:outer membrane lipoprotein LolB